MDLIIRNALLAGDYTTLAYWTEDRNYRIWINDPDLRTCNMISLLRNLENAAPPSDKVMAVIIMKGNPETAVKFFDIFFSEATPDELAFLLTKAQENEHLELAEYFQRRLDEL